MSFLALRQTVEFEFLFLFCEKKWQVRSSVDDLDNFFNFYLRCVGQRLYGPCHGVCPL